MDRPHVLFVDQLITRVKRRDAEAVFFAHSLNFLNFLRPDLAFALAVFVFEVRLQRVSLRRLIGAAVGSILGILGAHLMGLVLARTSIPEGSRSFLDVALLLVMTYIGLVLGTSKGDMLNLQALGGLFGNERGSQRQLKVLESVNSQPSSSFGRFQDNRAMGVHSVSGRNGGG